MGCIIKFKGQSIPEEQFLQYLNKQIAINNLFEEDKTLANSVYEAAGIKNENGSVKLNWVKGHAGNKMNELADKYAKSRDNISNMHDAYQTDSQQQILTRETEDKTILKINKINYSINHTTGIITALSDNGNKTITDESIISKVYSAFAEINGFGRVEYNGNTYSKVFNTIINMETGKVITDNNINNLFTSDIKTEVSKAVEVDSDVKTSSIILERKC